MKTEIQVEVEAEKGEKVTQTATKRKMRDTLNPRKIKP